MSCLFLDKNKYYRLLYMFSKKICECAIRYYMIDDDMSSKEKIINIKIIFGISRTAFFRNFSDYKKNLLKTPNVKKSKYTKNILIYIKIYICRFKIINANRIIFLVKNIFNVTISPSYFYVLLNKIGLTNKKVYIKNQPYSHNDYESMKQNFYEKIKDIKKNKIMSIDETAIYLNCKNHYGWAKKKDANVLSR